MKLLIHASVFVTLAISFALPSAIAYGQVSTPVLVKDLGNSQRIELYRTEIPFIRQVADQVKPDHVWMYRFVLVKPESAIELWRKQASEYDGMAVSDNIALRVMDMTLETASFTVVYCESGSVYANVIRLTPRGNVLVVPYVKSIIHGNRTAYAVSAKLSGHYSKGNLTVTVNNIVDPNFKVHDDAVEVFKLVGDEWVRQQHAPAAEISAPQAVLPQAPPMQPPAVQPPTAQAPSPQH